MEIIDLKEQYNSTYFHCLEDWNEEMEDGVKVKSEWFTYMKDRGLRVKLAKDDEGRICGMIQYIPSEYFFIDRAGYYVVMCIWVHGYKEGIGNYQKRGIGKVMLKAAEEDCKEMDTKGLLTWGISLPFFMRASWFKKNGYMRIDSDKGTILLWKPFEDGLEPPKMIRMKKKPDKKSGKVSIMAFVNGWCPGNNLTFERVMRAAKEFEGYMDVEILDTKNRKVVEEWGIFDCVFIDGAKVQKGAPPSYEKVYSLIEAKVKKIEKRVSKQ